MTPSLFEGPFGLGADQVEMDVGITLIFKLDLVHEENPAAQESRRLLSFAGQGYSRETFIIFEQRQHIQDARGGVGEHRGQGVPLRKSLDIVGRLALEEVDAIRTADA